MLYTSVCTCFMLEAVLSYFIIVNNVKILLSRAFWYLSVVFQVLWNGVYGVSDLSLTALSPARGSSDSILVIVVATCLPS